MACSPKGPLMVGRTRRMITQASMLGVRSPLSIVRLPTSFELEAEGRVRYLVMHGRQDDGGGGPVGALWLSMIPAAWEDSRMASTSARPV